MQVKLGPTIFLHLIGDDGEIRCDPGPYARRLRGCSQFSKVDRSGFYKSGSVGYVADPDIEVAIHTLQCSHYNSLFWSWDKEASAIKRSNYSAADKALRQPGVLASLAQPLCMDFDRFWQSRDGKVPLVREAISPAPRLNRGLEFFYQDISNFVLVSSGIEIEIVA